MNEINQEELTQIANLVLEILKQRKLQRLPEANHVHIADEIFSLNQNNPIDRKKIYAAFELLRNEGKIVIRPSDEALLLTLKAW